MRMGERGEGDEEEHEELTPATPMPLVTLSPCTRPTGDKATVTAGVLTQAVGDSGSEAERLKSDEGGGGERGGRGGGGGGGRVGRAALEEDVKCGVLCWKPTWLQRFNNPQWLLAFFSLYALSLGFVVNGINNVNTTALEQRFSLSSATVGLISSAYDVSAAILGLIISYLGSGRHKARMVGIAVIISSLGSILMALPHFTTGPYALGEDSGTSLCKPLNGTSHMDSCERQEESSLSHYLYLFIVGQMLHGVGGTTIYTVGVTLIDDSVRPSTTPLYLGILYGSAVLGPGLGYVVGGQFLSYYVDFDIVDTRMTPDDPRWVGAWWLGFILAAAINFLVSFPILCFGAELPSAKHIRQIRVSQAHMQQMHTSSSELKANNTNTTSNTTTTTTTNTGTVSGGGAGGTVSPASGGGSPVSTSEMMGDGWGDTAQHQPRSLKHFVQTSLTLLSNPCFLFVSLSMVSESISLSGVATFLPKMIEKKFRVSASKAAMLSGCAVVPSAAAGQFMGGFLAQRMKLGIPGLLKLCICGFVLTLLFAASVWIDCGREEFVGVTLSYPSSMTPDDADITLSSPCNAACGCGTDVFKPVCDSNNTMFFSPCHAGCVASPVEGLYINCSCLEGGWSDFTGKSGVGMGVAGLNLTVRSTGCRVECEIVYPFLMLLFLLTGFSMIAVAPGDSIQLRCVPEEIKTFAQGLKQLIVRILGTVVGPIITGRLLDNTCQVWRQSCSGSTMSCWLYDTDLMSNSAFLGVAGTKVISILMCVLALRLYRPPKAPPDPVTELERLDLDRLDLSVDLN